MILDDDDSLWPEHTTCLWHQDTGCLESELGIPEAHGVGHIEISKVVPTYKWIKKPHCTWLDECVVQALKRASEGFGNTFRIGEGVAKRLPLIWSLKPSAYFLAIREFSLEVQSVCLCALSFPFLSVICIISGIWMTLPHVSVGWHFINPLLSVTVSSLIPGSHYLHTVFVLYYPGLLLHLLYFHTVYYCLYMSYCLQHCLLSSQVLSVSTSPLLLGRPSFPSGVVKPLSNLIWILLFLTEMFCFLHYTLLLLLLLPPLPPFFPSCLSVSRRRGDSKSPRCKPIRLGESTRQSGRGFLIRIYLRNSAKQSLTCFHRPALFLLHHLLHLHHYCCMTSLGNTLLCQFVHFLLWFCFLGGLWRLWYTEIPVCSCRSFSQIPPCTLLPSGLTGTENYPIYPPPPFTILGVPNQGPRGRSQT